MLEDGSSIEPEEPNPDLGLTPEEQERARERGQLGLGPDVDEPREEEVAQLEALGLSPGLQIGEAVSDLRRDRPRAKVKTEAKAPRKQFVFTEQMAMSVAERAASSLDALRLPKADKAVLSRMVNGGRVLGRETEGAVSRAVVELHRAGGGEITRGPDGRRPKQAMKSRARKRFVRH